MLRASLVTIRAILFTGAAFTLLHVHPLLSQQAPGDEFWDPRFTRPGGVDGPVNSVVHVNDNDMFVGGNFSLAGTAQASSVARYDRSAHVWSDVDGGVRFADGTRGIVYSMVWYDGVLYIGGAFDSAGGVATANIAQWEGSGWKRVSGDFDAPVRALVAHDGVLYCGGGFSAVGGVPARNVAKYTIATRRWSDVGDGPNSAVFALTTDPDGRLYAGGGFSGCGDSAANHVARWDGTVWRPLGSDPDSNGVDDFVFGLAVGGGHVVAVGDFAAAGGVRANCIASWDPASEKWSPLDTVDSDGGLRAIVAGSGGDLYVAGDITRLAKIDTPRVARWRASAGAWFTCGSGTDGVPVALSISNTTLYVAGTLSRAGNADVANVALWRLVQESWESAGGGANNSVTGDVHAVAFDSRYLYVGGELTQVAGSLVSNIARWDSWSNRWDRLLSGTNGPVYALELVGTDVYVGGSFTRAGGVAADNVAVWSSASETWDAPTRGLHGGIQPVVHALRKAPGGDVFVGGRFDSAGSVAASSIARWNPATSSWSPLGSGVDGTVYAVDVSNDDRLFVGGAFSAAGGTDAFNAARYDDGVWSALGSGTDKGTRGDVFALRVRGDSVIVGGSFVQAGPLLAAGVAVWNDAANAWYRLDTSLVEGSIVRAITLGGGSGGGDVYIGGEFQGVGEIDASNIARWRESPGGWSALGSGVDGPVTTAFARDDELFVGGAFGLAGGLPSWRVGRWSGGTSGVATDSKRIHGSPGFLTSLVGGELIVVVPNMAAGSCSASIVDLCGRVRVMMDGQRRSDDLLVFGTPAAYLSSGPHIVVVKTPFGVSSRLVVVTR